ncbi:MFS transporter [Flavisolibacter ginsenosidimutans]|uniref:MFS transporter n=1 Tax=Flavisolibacter ginsenosidimutans TaxID=661481 RepID=A0A5B8UD34_9BACT|nr:MFS transporter [Flavisolibacter ginsenosidimutans]QEC54383.1 MFS transporter [Flavisolibacter ginsenosidimutans]
MITAAIPAKRISMKQAWLVVFLLAVVGCLNYLDRVMITTMRDSIRADMPMTDAQFGLLTSVFLWVYGLLSPLAGFLADKFNRSRVIIISLFVWSVVTWLTAHATTFNQLLATRALMGVSEACYIPAALALITDYHRGNTRSLATGIHMGGVMVGQSLGFLGGWIAENHHWSDAFNVFGLIGIAYAIVLLLFLRDASSGKNAAVEKESNQHIHFWDAMKQLFSRKSFLLLLLFWGLLGIIGWMTMGWLPTYYKEHFNLSQTVAGLYATGYLYPVAFVGALLGGYLSDRASKRGGEKARVLVPAIALAIAAPAVFIASSTDVVFVAIIGFLFYGLTRIFGDVNLMPILCQIADKRYRATGYGVLNLFASLVGGLGIYASGALRDAHINLSVLFKIAAVMLFIAVLLLLIIRKNLKEPVAVE